MRLAFFSIIAWLAASCAAWAAPPLTLPECVARALATLPAIATADAEVELTAAAQREAAASLYPALRADIQYAQEPGYREVITNRGLAAAQLIADYEVFDGGRRLAQVHAAEFAAAARQFGRAAARNQAVFDTTLSFYGLIHARQIEQELLASVARLTRYVAIVRALHASGQATANDELKMTLMLDDSRLRLNTATHDRAVASITLGALIGEYGRDDLAVAAPPFAMPPTPGTAARNPALSALERDRASAASALEAARDERFPKFSLELTGGFLGTDPPSTIERYAGASYGGLLSIPIADGGAMDARIDQARARVHAADAQVAAVRVALGTRLAAARSRLDEAETSSGLLQTELPAAQSAFALAWSRFLGGGAITMLEVADSYNQLLNLRLQAADERLAARQALAEMALVQGGTS